MGPKIAVGTPHVPQCSAIPLKVGTLATGSTGPQGNMFPVVGGQDDWGWGAGLPGWQLEGVVLCMEWHGKARAQALNCMAHVWWGVVGVTLLKSNG